MVRIHRRFWVINSWSVFSHDGIPGLLYMHHRHLGTRHFGTGVKVFVWHQCRSVWTLRIHWAGAEVSWAELSVFHCRLHNCCSVTRMNHASQSCPLHLCQQIPQCCHCLMECPQAEWVSDQTLSDVVVMMPWIWSCSRVQLLLWPSYGIGQAIRFLFCGFFFLSVFFFPCLFSDVTDWMSTILPHIMWP